MWPLLLELFSLGGLSVCELSGAALEVDGQRMRSTRSDRWILGRWPRCTGWPMSTGLRRMATLVDSVIIGPLPDALDGERPGKTSLAT